MHTALRRLARAASITTALLAPLSTAWAQNGKLTRADLLVTSDWLATQLKDPKLVLLHVGEKQGYDQEHIPGARFIELQDVSTPMTMDTTALALEMPSADKIRATFERFGISDDSRVIVYYGNDWVSPSTRILLTLQYIGLGARASLLDGGLPEWKNSSHPVTGDAPAAAKTGKITPKPTLPLIVDADFVKAHINAPGYKIIDARNSMFYDGPIQRPTGNMANGMPRPAIIPNHVPGALNIVFETAFDETNHLLPEAQLRALFTKAGVKPNDKLIAYCHIGQQATVIVYAARTLGYDVQLYDGSFHEWEMRKLPVESSRKGDK